MKVVLGILVATVCTANAGILRSADWDNLKVTFGIKVGDPGVFSPMPRTLKEATQAGWTHLDSHCSDSSQPFRGFRYWLNRDPAVILIYDNHGFIAGIQTAIDLSKVNYKPGPYRDGHPFINYKNMATLTAYFVDPSIVCKGRSPSDFYNQGTGDGLRIQNGTNPESMFLNIPMNEEVVQTTKWTQGKCTWAMGMHYWYDITSDMSCDNFFPVFLLYTKHKLSGFGWGINAGLTSPRYEHPTAQVAGHFITPEPKCFFSDPTFKKMSTMHIYMTSNPQFIFC